MSAMDQPETDETYIYTTTNLYEAAFIMSAGYAITIVTLSPTRKRFNFPPEAMIAAGEFMRNAPIGARTYAAHLRDIKELIGGSR